MNTLFNYINPAIQPLEIQETVVNAQDFFLTVNFSHFPVTASGVFVGNVSKNDIETFAPDKKISDYRYTLDGFFTRTTATVLDVLDDFAKNQTNILPILDQQNNYVGFYELEDIIQAFNDTPFFKETGAILIVEKGINDYSFSQIAQIIEGNNAKLLGNYISETTPDKVQITIKIANGSINEIIQTFRRYEYEILSEHQEDNYIKNLQERSDYLDKYLNI